MLEKIARPEEIRRWDGDMPVRHRYTPGVAGDAFFTALKDRGVLLGSRCEHCSYTYVPARLFCERCFAELAADTEVGPGGELAAIAGVQGPASRFDSGAMTAAVGDLQPISLAMSHALGFGPEPTKESE